MKTQTADEMALDIMLSDEPETVKLTRLRALRLQAEVALGIICPECGGKNIQDNGCSGRNASYLCEGCNHAWDAEEV